MRTHADALRPISLHYSMSSSFSCSLHTYRVSGQTKRRPDTNYRGPGRTLFVFNDIIDDLQCLLEQTNIYIRSFVFALWSADGRAAGDGERSGFPPAPVSDLCRASAIYYNES